jgi:hypothetical protein
MSYVDVDILAIPWESRGAALIYFTVRPNLFENAAPPKSGPWLQGDDIVGAHL